MLYMYWCLWLQSLAVDMTTTEGLEIVREVSIDFQFRKSIKFCKHNIIAFHCCLCRERCTMVDNNSLIWAELIDTDG